MATSDIEMQNTDCPVCHDKYSDPKILPCAHLLCRDCLVSWMKTKTDAPCPLCRSVIVDPKHFNIKNLDVFVDSLPTDHAMSAMVESLKIFSGKRVCHAHNNAVATSLCLDCNVKLCQGCIEVHRKLPLTSFHKIKNLATLTPRRLAARRQAPCSIHPDKTAELVCVDHNVLICQLCATAKHRTCSEVTYVSEVSGKYKQALLEMENKLNEAESSLSQAITELEERLLKTEKSTNAALAEIDTTCDILLKSVETCRKRLKKLVTEENDKMKAAVNEQKNIISHKRVRVTSHQGLIKRVLQMENDETLVSMVRSLEGRVSELNTSLPQDTNSCLSVTLKIDKDAISLVEETLQKIIEPIFNFTPGTEKIIVEETDIRYSGDYIGIGVCAENTLSVTLPKFCFEMKTFVGVTGSLRTSEDSCPALKTVKTGSRLGVMIDTSHSLHVYVNGKDQGVMAKNVAQTCWGVFDLRYFLKKVSTLPVTST